MALIFDNRISLGHLVTFGTLAVGVALAWGDLTARTNNLADDTERNSKSISSNEGRIRSVEYTTARQDERLILILDSLRKIEGKIDAAEGNRR